MRASTAHSALLLLAVLVALAAAGCNGYMLYHVQRAFASTSTDYDLVRWRALLIAAEAVCAATAVYALAHSLTRRVDPYAPFVAVRIDVLFLLLLGGGAAATGVLLFLSRVPGTPERLYTAPNCVALGARCGAHFAGGAALLTTALLLLCNAVFEGVYASRHPGGWGESLHALSSELGSDGPKYKKKTRLSISEPFQLKDSMDGAPLMPPAPCATLPAWYGELDADYRTPAPPTPARAESTLGPRFPKSSSAGSVSTLATTPLFGLAPHASPTPSQNGGTFGRTRSSPSQSTDHRSLSTNYSENRSENYASHEVAYPSPPQRSYPSPRENPYATLRPPGLLPGVEERPKLSMEQLDRKRTLFAEGML